MYIGLYVKYPLFLSDFNETWIFSTYIRKSPQISDFMKIRPVGAELFHADGRTDMTKLIVAFLQILGTRLKKQVCNWCTPWLRIRFPNVLRFQSKHVNVTIFTPVRKVRPYLRGFSRKSQMLSNIMCGSSRKSQIFRNIMCGFSRNVTNAQQHYVRIFTKIHKCSATLCADFHESHKCSVSLCADFYENSQMLSNIMCGFSRKSQTLSNIICGFSRKVTNAQQHYVRIFTKDTNAQKHHVRIFSKIPTTNVEIMDRNLLISLTKLRLSLHRLSLHVETFYIEISLLISNALYSVNLYCSVHFPLSHFMHRNR
jgi:hypothetical protein